MSVAMGDTFLTESRSMDVPEPEAMARVREEHSRLQGVVFSLNKKISQVLAKQEGDFLAAYRAHMYTVQKELQTLRQRVIEAENVLQKNDKVQKLEDECDWYRKEALRLDSFNTAMKKDLKYMKGKLEILEDDRNWLARQLKACRKQDKVLRAELGLRVESEQHEGREVTSAVKGKGTPNVESSQLQPLLSGAMGALDRVRRSEQSASSPELSAFGEAERLELQTAPDRERRCKLMRHDGNALTKRVRTLERKLANEQKENLRVRSTRARDAVERAEMEDFFMRCIEDVKKHIQQRKMKAKALHSRSAGPRQRSHGSLALRGNPSPGDTHGGTRSSVSSILETAPSKTTLEEFTASDRRAVVESLLQRDDVVAQLFDTFFPVASPGEQLQPGRQ